MISELYGKSSGTNFGKAGSMHLFDKDNGVLASIPIVSSGIPMAVGAALNFKLKKLKNIGVAFYGDAATEEGIFHESLILQLQKNCQFYLCAKIIITHAIRTWKKDSQKIF